jgi:flavin-dependent dehydrogenase
MIDHPDSHNNYDVAIVGGGLSGLSLAILLARKKYRVVLFEKEQYPFHKVCGEYISLESLRFLKELGIDADKLQLPLISRLQISTPKGNLLEQELPLGGIGISRYLLDHTLAQIAKAEGVTLKEGIKVNDIKFKDDLFQIQTNEGTYTSTIGSGCFGKRSNMDVKWKRNFIAEEKKRLSNYIAVKYHIRSNFSADSIALHCFKDGYCGISRVEDNKYCLCYLTTASNLQKSNNSIKEMEQAILYNNPHIRKIFTDAQFLFSAPVTISQVSFEKKNRVQDHILLLGDAAGMITPLCGNGMSMALYSAKLAAEQVTNFLNRKISRRKMETEYDIRWQKQFARRLWIGRKIQALFYNTRLLELFIKSIRPFPSVIRFLIRQTHGQPF